MTEFLALKMHIRFVFLCQNNFSHVTPWRTVLHSALMQGGFHHGVDAGKNTIDSDRIFIIYLTFSLAFSGSFVHHFV